MNFHNISEAVDIEIRTYAELIKGGGLVAFPTETVYGLGASAWNPEAIRKVFEYKGRPSDNPLIVHISRYSHLLTLAAEIPEESRLLMQKFWPGPLTLVFEKKPQVLDSVSGGLDSVAVRMPDHIYALRLIELTGPLVAPSANKSGRPSPTNATHVQIDFDKRIPVLDGGVCEIGLESTVLDVRTHPFRILRPGRITAKMIQDRTGIEVASVTTNFDTESPASPGMKYTHYAPNARVRWMNGNEINGILSSDKILYLTQKAFTLPVDSLSKIVNFDKDLTKMSRELYDWFRTSDSSDFPEIAIQPFEMLNEQDMYAALVNRINKAIGKS